MSRISRWCIVIVPVVVLVILAFLEGTREATPQELPVKRWEFKQDLERSVGLLRGGLIFVGKLDEDGTFVFDPSKTPLDPKEMEAAKLDVPIINVPQTEPIRKNHDGVYVTVTPPESVMEFRSGWLIRGKLTAEGDFVPDAYGKVTEFRSQWTGPGGVRIYNLPGRFVEVPDPKKPDQPWWR